MIQKNDWEVVLNHTAELGEGPVWDGNLRRLLWIDILKGQIHQYYPSTRQHITTEAGQMVGAVSLTTSGKLIAALHNGFHWIDLVNSTVSSIVDPEEHLPQNRFNDGKCDPAGRFWAGTMSVRDAPQAGKLYMLDSNLTVTEKIDGVGCSNGLAWSHDHSLFYYIDTATRAVVQYDYEQHTGKISNPQVIISIPAEDGVPDGMTIDTEGMLWIALWDGWKIVRYNPATGEKNQELSLPVARPTSCCFGGENYQDLYVTTASTGLSQDQLNDQPHAGSLFVFKSTGFRGLPANEFVEL